MMIRFLQSTILIDPRWSGFNLDLTSSVFPMAEIVDPWMSIAPSNVTSRKALTGMIVA